MLSIVNCSFPEFGEHHRLPWRNETIAKCLI
jgi:hypothetical protein